MTDKVQKIREEVERLKRWNNNVRNSTRHMTLQEEDFNRGKHSSYLEILNFIDSLQEEPVSEELEEEIIRYIGFPQEVDEDVSTTMIRKAAHHFANWQKEQFEKNRLAACTAQTKEEADREWNFVEKMIKEEHRQPTYSDAIEYGMQLQKEQMLVRVIDGVITFDYYGEDNKTYGCIAHDSFCLEDFGLKDTDKVKMIIVKDEMS